MPEETDNVADFLRFVNFCWCATHSWRFGHDNSGGDMVLSGGVVDSMFTAHHDIDFLFIDRHRVALPSNVHLSKEQTEGKDVLYIQSSLTSNDIHPGYARLSQYGSETLLSSAEVKKPMVDSGFYHTLTRSPVLAWKPDDPNLPVRIVEDDMAACSLLDKSINAKKQYLNELQNAASVMEMVKHSATTLNRTVSEEFNPDTSNLNHQQLLDRQVEAEPRKCNNKTKSNVFVNSLAQRMKEVQEMLAGMTSRSRLNTEYVPYIRCPVWPHEAAEWITRIRTQNWPQPSLINQCVAGGCGFVAAAHKNTSADLADFEFRFSFSFAERRLLNSWLPTQNFIYTILKEKVCEVNKQFDKESRILCSYHMKTLMLWFAETKPPEYWSSENLVSTLEELLLEMAKCLIERQLSHYFIPYNNLFDCPCNSDILDSTLEALFVAAESIEKCSLAIYYAYLFACKITARHVVPRSHVISFSLANKAATTITNMAVACELNDLFCGLSLLRQVSERSCSDLQPRSYSDQSLVTISEFLLAATYDHFGSAKISYSLWKSFVDNFINSRRLFGRYSRRLNPSLWRRGFAAKDSLQKNKINVENDSFSPSSIENSFHTEPIWDQVSNTFNVVQMMKAMKSYRLSRILSTAYLSNFHYKVCQDYEAAIEICNEVLKEAYMPFLTSWHIPLSTVWSCIFDVDVQTMLGLALLYESVRTNATTATSLQSEPMTIDYEDFYIPIPADVFLQYVTARCRIAIISREIISDCRLMSVNDVVERLSAVYDRFRENTESRVQMLKCFYREGYRRCDDKLFANDLSIKFFLVTTKKYSDSLLTSLQTF